MFHEPIKDCIWSKYPQGSITQWFGENPALYARWGLTAHPGIDIVAPHGTPLLATEDGIIVDVKLSPDGYGKHIRLLSKDHVNGNYRLWVYGHCHTIDKKVGDEVKAGQQIATMGNTGFVISGSTPFWKFNPYAGTHLHLGLRIVRKSKNGWSYPDSDIKLEVNDYDNGYKGNIDHRPYWDNNEDVKRQQMLTIISLLNTLISLLKK